jgi:hypothetical protein
VASAAAAGGLLAGDPDTVARARVRCGVGEVVGGGCGAEVVQRAGELSAGNGGLDFGQIKAVQLVRLVRLVRHGRPSPRI